MAWEGSDRRARLPADWPAIRQRILTRDGRRCTETMRNGHRCHDPATDVDHIIPSGPDTDDNLTSLCAWHHARKSAREGQQARRPVTMRRPGEAHPGLKQ